MEDGRVITGNDQGAGSARFEAGAAAVIGNSRRTADGIIFNVKKAKCDEILAVVLVNLN